MEVVPLSRRAHCLHDPATGRNVGLVSTRDGLVLVDAGDTAVEVARVLGHVAATSSAPIAYCILTHWPGDEAVDALTDVSVIAHCAATTASGSRGRALASAEARLLFADRLYMSIGGTILEVVHTPGSTPGSCVVTLPGASLLFGGDTIRVDDCPPIGVGPARDWAASLASLVTLNARYIVPARGRLAKSDDLTSLAATLRDRSGLPQQVEPLAPRRAARESRYLQMASSELDGNVRAVVGMSVKGAAGR